jgi:NRPS condensation-like uncharacterized protein
MLLWNDLHPYNSVHVVQVLAPLDLARLSEVVNRTLRQLGLGNVKLNAHRGIFHYAGGAAKYEIKIIKVGDDPHADLAAEAERQLNTRFAHDQSFSPVRFFVAVENSSFFLGLVYFHAVADGESVVNLMKSVVACYLGNEDPPELELYPRSRDAILFRDPGLFMRKVLAIAGQLRTLRRARRRTCQDSLEMRNGVTFFSLKPEELQALVQTGKTWDVTLNDLFLALLLQSFSRLLPEVPAPARRSRLAIGCIVNLRKELGVENRRTFGLFLGSFVVTCEPRPGAGLRELARAVQQQTSRIKQNRLYVATAMELHFARALLRFFSLERRKKFYQKNYPLWGGITNMNLDSIWQPLADKRPADYLRAVSTGPATPLVLSITTIGGGVNIGLSYRTACFSALEVEQVKSGFLDEFRQMRHTA